MKNKVDIDVLRMRLERLDQLNEFFYQMPGASCGGRLHIILDDGNLRDGDLVWCYRYLYEDDDYETVAQRPVALAILHELAMLGEAQRFVWWDKLDRPRNAHVEEVANAANKRVEYTNEGYVIVD